jgi:hypothetical protein
MVSRGKNTAKELENLYKNVHSVNYASSEV